MVVVVVVSMGRALLCPLVTGSDITSVTARHGATSSDSEFVLNSSSFPTTAQKYILLTLDFPSPILGPVDKPEVGAKPRSSSGTPKPSSRPSCAAPLVSAG